MRPYEPLNMTTKDWLKIEPTELDLSELVHSQKEIDTDLLDGEDSSHCGDMLIHVVLFRGIKYISDGHHRVERAKRKGKKLIEGRLLIK